jgi:hypothetical protein
MQEVYEIEQRENRQAQIEHMDIGDTVSISRRIEMMHGFAEGAIAEHNRQLRGIADQQTHRARRRFKERKFKVENGSFMTREGALVITAAITRVE